MTNKVRLELQGLPWYRASRSEWRRRGYKVRKGEYNVQCLVVWNGMHYNRIKIYDIGQTGHIRGVKAEGRRQEFWRQDLWS